MKKVLVVIVATLSLGTGFAQNKKAKKHATKAVATAKVNAPVQATGAVTTTSVATENKGDAKNALQFSESSYSFGKIKQGVPVTHIFNFKNTSTAPVVIESATAQCGCTTPEYPKAPVAKGASEKISVTYNAAAVGSFTKQVTVRLAKQTEPIILTITGEVVANDADKKGK